MVGWMVAAVFVAPALYYNLDWSPSARLGDNLGAAALIVGSAVTIEACRYAKAWWQVLVGVTLGLALVLNNGLNAFENLTNAADHRTDHRKAAMVGAQSQWSERSGWSVKVEKARAIVGDEPASKYKADLQQYQQQNAKRWNATSQCEDISARASEAFCAEIARLTGLYNTVTERDEAAEKIREIDRASAGTVVPSSADPFAAKFGLILGMFGAAPTEEGIRALKTLSKTLAIEGLATFVPMLWLALVDGLIAAAMARPALTFEDAPRNAQEVAGDRMRRLLNG